EEVNEEVFILIKDTAGGVPEELTDKIFESRFTTKDKEKGSGLGLYMSKVIIEEHMNGTISVGNQEFVYEDHSYIGAEFKIVLEAEIKP
ncbi:MAG: histidine kinase, partial [Campylobacteraceae bacterium]|nr:histidine kinase [Campylobacteraceae bacterium]